MLSTALIVIDVQQALCVGDYKTFESERVIKTINSLSNKARAKNIPVIFIQHQTEEGVFKPDADGWQLAGGLEHLKTDLYVSKRFSDAFKETELEKILKAKAIEHLIVCGMQSEFCVDSTIRHALARDYAVTIVADAHTTVDTPILPAAKISAHHNSTWQNITSYKQVPTIIETDAVINRM